ncbi:MAG: hypothetical protein ACFB20_01890 [Opitutales bacterium]
MTREELKAQIDTLPDAQVEELETLLQLVNIRNSPEYPERIRRSKEDVIAGRLYSEEEVRRRVGLQDQ